MKGASGKTLKQSANIDQEAAPCGSEACIVSFTNAARRDIWACQECIRDLSRAP